MKIIWTGICLVLLSLVLLVLVHGVPSPTGTVVKELKHDDIIKQL